MVRRSRLSIVSILTVTVVFLSGCFVGAAVQAFGGAKPAQVAAAVEKVAPVPVSTPDFQPLNNKTVRTIPVRGDGSFVTGSSDPAKSSSVAN